MARQYSRIAWALVFGLGIVIGDAAMSPAVANDIVDCARGKSIQAAIDKAKPGETVEVRGACVENVAIGKDGISLVAGAGGASITAADNSAATILVAGARGVVIAGFGSLMGGQSVVQVVDLASATIADNVIENGVLHGIYVADGSTSTVRGNDIRNNGTDPNSFDGHHGVIVLRSATAHFLDNTIRASARNGVAVAFGSSATLGQNILADNGRDGLFVAESSVELGRPFLPNTTGPNTFVRNGGFGVNCTRFSVLRVNENQTFGTGADANLAGTASIPGSDCRVPRKTGVTTP